MSKPIVLPEIDIQELMKQAQEEIKQAAISSVKSQIKWTVERQLSEQIAPIVQKFVEEEIAPTLREQLIGQKSQILEQVALQVTPLAEAVAKAVLSQMAKNLGEQYQRTKIVEALLK
jgi:regulator of sirC expression with transglutaminase-like and TPR domain